LTADRAPTVFAGNRQPWRPGAEIGAFGIIPGHGRATAIAAFEGRPKRQPVGIAQGFVRHVCLGQPKLFALIDAHRAAQRTDQRGQQIGQSGRRLRPAPAAEHARHIMIGYRPARPTVGHPGFERAHRVANVGGGKIVGQQLEAVGHVQALALGVLGHGGERVFRGNLAQCGRAGVAIKQGAQVFEKPEVFRLGVVVMVILIGVRIVRAEAAPGAFGRWLGRVVAQRGIVEAEIDGVQAQAVDTPIQPEPHVVQRGCAHLGVMEIEVGHRSQKVVQKILLPARLPLPGHPAENRQPVVGRRAVRARIGPHVPIGLGVVAAFAAFEKPGMIAGTVAEHLIDHHLQPQPVGLGQQPVEILQGAEQRIDRARVGDVVAKIRHRRLEEWRHPDRVHAQAGHVVQPFDDAGQIAHAIAVAVPEAARVNLIDDGAAPPGCFGHEFPRRTRSGRPRNDAGSPLVVCPPA